MKNLNSLWESWIHKMLEHPTKFWMRCLEFYSIPRDAGKNYSYTWVVAWFCKISHGCCRISRCCVTSKKVSEWSSKSKCLNDSESESWFLEVKTWDLFENLLSCIIFLARARVGWSFSCVSSWARTPACTLVTFWCKCCQGSQSGTITRTTGNQSLATKQQLIGKYICSVSVWLQYVCMASHTDILYIRFRVILTITFNRTPFILELILHRPWLQLISI